MRTFVLPVFIALAALQAVACREPAPQPPADQPDHPLLQDLEPPPLNRPISVPQLPEQRQGLQLPPDDLPAVLLLRDGAPFSGQLQTSGQMTVGDSLIEFRPSTGTPLRILYRLPVGMNAPTGGQRTGSLDVTELSGPQGADRRIVLSTEQGLVFSEAWQTAAEPVTVPLYGGVRIVQSAVDARETEAEYTAARIQAFDGRAVADIPIGEVATVQTSAGVIQVFVEVSHFFSGDERGQYPSNYIVHFWAVGQV